MTAGRLVLANRAAPIMTVDCVVPVCCAVHLKTAGSAVPWYADMIEFIHTHVSII